MLVLEGSDSPQQPWCLKKWKWQLELTVLALESCYISFNKNAEGKNNKLLFLFFEKVRDMIDETY